jgi:amino-acid N-acetyltransferase
VTDPSGSQPCAPLNVVLRKPIVHDVPAMAAIINGYASQGKMLPRSHHRLYSDLRDFYVATVDGRVVGCGGLSITWADLAEVRSLAIEPGYVHQGIGRQIVKRLLAEARELGLPRVFALTYQQAFFERMGFTVVSRDTLPHKIWGECLDCPKFQNCDEIAMIYDLDQPKERAK